MDLCPVLGEQIDEPVVPEGGLQDHLWVLTRFCDGCHHLRRVVEDPLRRQVVAFFVHPHDHRPAAVQVDADILSFGHVGTSLSLVPWCCNRECVCTRSGT